LAFSTSASRETASAPKQFCLRSAPSRSHALELLLFRRAPRQVRRVTGHVRLCRATVAPPFVACSGVIVIAVSADASVGPLFRFTRIKLATQPLRTCAALGCKLGGHRVGNIKRWLRSTARHRLPGQVPVDTMASMILGYAGAAHCNLAASAADCASRRALTRGGIRFLQRPRRPAGPIACETYCDASFGEITVKIWPRSPCNGLARPSATKRSNRLDGLCGSVGDRRPHLTRPASGSGPICRSF